VRQSERDRALYCRELRRTVRTVFLPELTTPAAVDAAALVDRILAQFIVEEESAAAVSAEFGARFREILTGDPPDGAVTPDRFDELRRQAAAEVAAAARDGKAGIDDQARRLVAVERAFLERVEELRAGALSEHGNDVASSTGTCSVTPEQLTEFLRRRLVRSPEVMVTRVEVLPGGRSKETILVSVAGTTELPPEVVLRKDRSVGLLQTKAADEFEILRAVHRFGGVPVAEPYLAEEEGHGLGEGTLLLMERAAGKKAGEFFPDLAAPSEHRATIGLQVAAALARLHTLPFDRLECTRLDPAAAVVTKDSLAATVEAMVDRIDGLSGPPSATVPLARRWLLDHLGDALPTRRLCLLQGDIGLHNMLVDGDRLTALVDWESSAIGPPAREMAGVWNAATALLPWSEFVAAYVASGGPPEGCDERALRFYRVQGALGGFMTSRMGGHLFRTGSKRDLLTAHSGLDSHFRCARNLARALADAIADDASENAYGPSRR
jgi:aminoglycoside phosphotransferase (APT) family kinase protein